MKDRKRNAPRKDSHDPAEESEAMQNRNLPGNLRTYESGRNRDMQAQSSNRQGDGNPTQQGRDDR